MAMGTTIDHRLSGVMLTFVLFLCTSFKSISSAETCRFGDGCRYDCNCNGNCNSQNGCVQGNCTRGWDGPTCQRQNVALDKQANQSSRYTDDGDRYSWPRFAVDGVLGHSFRDTPCTHTLPDPPAYWTVNLTNSYRIHRFRIYNRDEHQCSGKCGRRLNGFTLSVGNSSGVYQECYQDHTTGEQGPGAIINKTCDMAGTGGTIVGNSVKISLSSGKPLTLCEVEIFVCSEGWYGDFCDKECNTTTACSICDLARTRCEGCVTGRWGEDCLHDCGSCWNDHGCDKLSGECPPRVDEPRCKAGYNGTKCSELCLRGTYGPDCRESCGHCNHGDCNTTSGHCQRGPNLPTCRTGYMPPECRAECDDGKWGDDCQQNCHCFEDKMCNKSSGQCPQVLNTPVCSAGYEGINCSTRCTNRTHGPDCTEECGLCANGTCNFISEHCPVVANLLQCVPGYAPPLCKTETQVSHVGVIVGGVVGALLLAAALAIAIIVYRRRTLGHRNKGDLHDLPVRQTDHERLNQPTEREGREEQELEARGDRPRSVENPLVSNSVPLERFCGYVTAKDSAERFKAQFEKFPVGLHAKHSVADQPVNNVKSRYRNLVAYDHSRVILKPSDKDNSDYINANYIDGYTEPKKYIASQGPNGANIDDFVRMIWEQDAGKVIMLTNLTENTKEKCLQYWPNVGTSKFGVIEVSLIDEEVLTDLVIRTLRLRHLQEKSRSRQIKQFHFTTWPDHGVPFRTGGLLSFRDKVLEYKTPLKGPMVVHCSAGIGRSGTFIALDYLMCQANAEGLVDVPACVFKLREQRVNMVQTLEQYVFLHEVLVDALKLRENAIPSVEFSRVYAELNTVNPDTGETKLAKKFRVLEKQKPSLDDDVFSSARDPENVAKNRSQGVLAAEFCRPILFTPVTDRNDYINAVFLPAYQIPKGFILTQSPLPDTVVDFWRLVYEQGVSSIITLDDMYNVYENEGVYCPEESGKFGPFEVRVTNVSEKENFSVYTYELTYKNTKVSDPIKQFRCAFWSALPSVESIPALLEVIEMVQCPRQEAASARPILVLCRDGFTNSGLFCAASSVIAGVKLDQEVAIPRILRQMRRNRPEIITDLERQDFGGMQSPCHKKTHHVQTTAELLLVICIAKTYKPQTLTHSPQPTEPIKIPSRNGNAWCEMSGTSTSLLKRRESK